MSPPISHALAVLVGYLIGVILIPRVDTWIAWRSWAPGYRCEIQGDGSIRENRPPRGRVEIAIARTAREIRDAGARTGRWTVRDVKVRT